MKINALSLVLIFLSSCVLMCVLFPILGAILGATSTFALQFGESPEPPFAIILVMGLLYLFLIALYLLGYALHQGITFALTDADLQGRVIDLRASFKEATSRLPSLFATLILRLLCDVSFIVLFGSMAAVLIALNETNWLGLTTGPWFIPAFFLAYLGILVWMLVVRSFLGLSGPAAQYETLGPIAALGRSISLLRGHRLQMILLRVVWGIIAFILYIVSYVPIAGIAFFSTLAQGDGTNQFAPIIFAVVLLPVMILWYFFALHILSFDSVLEGAFFRRIVQPKQTEDIARIFS